MVELRELRRWLREARRGEKRVYHLGHLAFDRVRLVLADNGQLKARPVEPQDSIGRMFWRAYEAGKVLLVQKRLGPWEYQYWAVKR